MILLSSGQDPREKTEPVAAENIRHHGLYVGSCPVDSIHQTGDTRRFAGLFGNRLIPSLHEAPISFFGEGVFDQIRDVVRLVMERPPNIWNRKSVGKTAIPVRPGPAHIE